MKGALKTLITDMTAAVEKKGLQATSLESYLRLLVISNEKWAVPVGVDERRFFILDVAATYADRSSKTARQANVDYFNALHKEMEEEGGLEAMLFDLLQRDIKSNLRAAPETAGLQDQREVSLNPYQRWLLEIAKSGLVPAHRKNASGHATTVLLGEDVTGVRAEEIREAVMAERKPLFFKEVGVALASAGVKRVRVRHGNTLPYEYVFPAHEEFRANVSRLLNLSLEQVTEECDDGDTIEGDAAEFGKGFKTGVVIPLKSRAVH